MGRCVGHLVEVRQRRWHGRPILRHAKDAPRDWLPLLTVAARESPMAGPYDEGYPPSTEADLDPGSGLNEPLEEADREVGDEHRTGPEGRRPDGSLEDEDRFEDADRVDDAEFLHQLAGGRS
jgi:hypothetical protein